MAVDPGARAAPIPEAGAVAPDFELQDSTGSVRRLSALTAERPLALIFYRGAW